MGLGKGYFLQTPFGLKLCVPGVQPRSRNHHKLILNSYTGIGTSGSYTIFGFDLWRTFDQKP
jgi:hypothetical protein